MAIRSAPKTYVKSPWSDEPETKFHVHSRSAHELRALRRAVLLRSSVHGLPASSNPWE